MRSLRRALSALVAGWLAAVSAWAAPEVTVARGGRIPLAGHLELLTDPAGRLSLAEVQAAAEGCAFAPLPGNVSRGYGKGTVWLRFTLFWGSATGDRKLEVPVAFLEDIRLFSPGAEGTYTEQPRGAILPLTGAADRYRHAVFSLPPPAFASHRPQVCFLRVATRTTMAVEPILWEPGAFWGAAVRESFWFGGFFGIAFIILIGNLVYWIRLRESLHLHYGAYVGCMILLSLGTSGYGNLLFTPDHPRVFQWLIGTTNCLFLGLGGQVFSGIVDFRKGFPRAGRAYGWTVWGLAGAGVAVCAMGGYFAIAPLTQLLLLAMALFNGALAGWLAVRGNGAARLYLLAFGVQLAGAVLLLGRNLGWLPATFATEHAFYLASIFHLILMNVPVAYRLERFKRERDVVRTEALAAAERHGAELEARVAARTLELHREKAQAEQALAEMRKMVDEQERFISTISHEFRTPLSIIDGSAQIIGMARGSASARIPGHLGKIRGAVRRLLHLLDTSFHPGRMAAGTWAFRPQPLDLARELAMVAARAQATTDTHRIVVDAGFGVETVTCDPEWISIALQNLLDNAIKYTPDGGDIHLRIFSPEPGWFAFEVADPGIGIPEDQQQDIFKRFFRGQNAAATPGAGVGLDLVKHIVDTHGGRLTLSSRPGTGTVFRVFLPRTRPEAGPTPD
ncbi:sensor histidine kinase [Geothrix sp. 21YS21S-4]|uniref:sensor histidine kinase n=1 Tax=Geothrix sp. 21YS21S-4 TaxID=3068889 RepID=UPI0027B8EB8A|nr:sensor histidine kinase [Geothrix sp. 21YS21S-4]